MNRSYKTISAFLCLIMLLSVLSAHADNYWEKYWKPGEYTVDFTSGEDRIAEIMDESIRNSEGTPVRTDADQESVEAQYERYISIFPDGSPVVYEDI